MLSCMYYGCTINRIQASLQEAEGQFLEPSTFLEFTNHMPTKKSIKIYGSSIPNDGLVVQLCLSGVSSDT